MVVDPQGPEIDKGCGEGLMPDAVNALSALGVQITARDGHVFEGIRFLDARHSASAHFRSGAGIGVRRTHLHARLAERAWDAGVMLRWGSRAVLPAYRGCQTAQIDGVATCFRWLVGADGEASSVRRWAGLDEGARLSRRFGFRRHYGIRPWSSLVEVYWAPGGQAYVTPVAEDCVSVAFLSRDPSGRSEDLLARLPELAARLRQAPLISRQRGGVSATRRLRRVAAGNVALVGDASGSADAITGEGLGMSFQQAAALAESLADGGVEEYARAHRAIARRPHRMAAMMLMLDRWPVLERGTLKILAAAPRLFEDLLAVHTGDSAFSRPSFA